MTANAAAAAAEATVTLQKGIAELYDESSGVWEDLWGDHMHHGFYEPGSDAAASDHRAAQIRMIEEALRFASLSGNLNSITACSVQLMVDFLVQNTTSDSSVNSVKIAKDETNLER